MVKSASTRVSNDELLSHIRTFRLPPDGFDPRKASKRQLTLYGLPHPPDARTHPGAADTWKRMAAHARGAEWIVPEFKVQRRPRPRMTTGTAQALVPSELLPLLRSEGLIVAKLTDPAIIDMLNASPQLSGNWSGAYAPRLKAEPLNWVSADFGVPGVQPPASSSHNGKFDDGFYQAATWVGLDGWTGSPDVVQAGVTGTMTWKNSWGVGTTYAWVEFFPTAEIVVTNFPVAPGDRLAITVCAPFSTTHGVAWLWNQTTNTHTSVGFDAPSGTALAGGTAEWIVEHSGTSTPSTFADYGSATLRNCTAGGRRHEVNLLSSSPINMWDGGLSRVISRGTIETRTQLRCTHE